MAPAEVHMEYFFSHSDAYMVLGFLALTLPACVAVVAFAGAYYWQKVRREEVRAGLKRAMLERGMSAEEIRIVIEAGSEGATNATTDSAAMTVGKA
jgi:hypothetical protein